MLMSVIATSTSATTLTAVVSRAMPPGRSSTAPTTTTSTKTADRTSWTSRLTPIGASRSAMWPYVNQTTTIAEATSAPRRMSRSSRPTTMAMAAGHGHRPQDGLERLAEGDLGQVLGEQEQDRVGGEQQGMERERSPAGGSRLCSGSPPGMSRGSPLGLRRAGRAAPGPWPSAAGRQAVLPGWEPPEARAGSRLRHRRRQSSQRDDALSSAKPVASGAAGRSMRGADTDAPWLAVYRRRVRIRPEMLR